MAAVSSRLVPLTTAKANRAMGYSIKRVDDNRLDSGGYDTLASAQGALDEIDHAAPFTYYLVDDSDPRDRRLSFKAKTMLVRQGRTEDEWFAASPVGDDDMDAEKLTEAQMRAVVNFADQKGRGWRDQLMRCWERASYPGIDPDDGAALQQVRNQFGPEWLVNVQIADLVRTLAENRVDPSP